MALIEIDGLPIKNGDFPWRTVNNQMVDGINMYKPFPSGCCFWLKLIALPSNLIKLNST